MASENDSRSPTIRAFEFKKFNHSVVNRVVLDPLAEWTLRKLPDTISANQLSVASLAVVLFGYLVVLLLGTDIRLKQAAPDLAVGCSLSVCSSTSCWIISIRSRQFEGLRAPS